MSVPVLYCRGQFVVPRAGTAAAVPDAERRRRVERRCGVHALKRNATPTPPPPPSPPPEQRCPQHRALLPVLPVGRSARPGHCTGDCEGHAVGADPGCRAGTRRPSGATSRAGRARTGREPRGEGSTLREQSVSREGERRGGSRPSARGCPPPHGAAPGRARSRSPRTPPGAVPAGGSRCPPSPALSAERERRGNGREGAGGRPQPSEEGVEPSLRGRGAAQRQQRLRQSAGQLGERPGPRLREGTGGGGQGGGDAAERQRQRRAVGHGVGGQGGGQAGHRGAGPHLVERGLGLLGQAEGVGGRRRAEPCGKTRGASGRPPRRTPTPRPPRGSARHPPDRNGLRVLAACGGATNESRLTSEEAAGPRKASGVLQSFRSLQDSGSESARLARSKLLAASCLVPGNRSPKGSSSAAGERAASAAVSGPRTPALGVDSGAPRAPRPPTGQPSATAARSRAHGAAPGWPWNHRQGQGWRNGTACPVSPLTGGAAGLH